MVCRRHRHTRGRGATASYGQVGGGRTRQHRRPHHAPHLARVAMLRTRRSTHRDDTHRIPQWPLPACCGCTSAFAETYDFCVWTQPHTANILRQNTRNTQYQPRSCGLLRIPLGTHGSEVRPCGRLATQPRSVGTPQTMNICDSKVVSCNEANHLFSLRKEQMSRLHSYQLGDG